MDKRTHNFSVAVQIWQYPKANMKISPCSSDSWMQHVEKGKDDLPNNESH